MAKTVATKLRGSQKRQKQQQKSYSKVVLDSFPLIQALWHRAHNELQVSIFIKPASSGRCCQKGHAQDDLATLFPISFV